MSEGMLWISDPLGGASADAGWHWRDGELVYTRKARWVQAPPIDRGGALRAEIVADFRRASGIGRQRKPRWADLRAEIAGEFDTLTTRAPDVIDALAQARTHHLLQRKERRAFNREQRCAYMKRWRAAKSKDPEWLKADRARSRESCRRAERKQRKAQLASRPARQCPECAASFVPLLAKRVYCTEVCRVRAAKRRYWRAHQAKLNQQRNTRRQARATQRRAA